MLQARGSGLQEADKPDGQRIQMLTYQNSKLSAQLEVQRKEIAALEAKMSQMDNKQIDYEQTLSCVDRLWTQLNDDISFLAKRTALDEDTSDAPSNSGQDHLTSNGSSSGDVLPNITDPFLQRLVRSHSAASKVVAAKSKELTEDATDVETALLRRSEATKACLARLLDLQRQQEQRVAELASSLGKDAGSALQDEVLSTHVILVSSSKKVHMHDICFVTCVSASVLICSRNSLIGIENCIGSPFTLHPS
jgi:hypothetical protein